MALRHESSTEHDGTSIRSLMAAAHADPAKAELIRAARKRVRTTEGERDNPADFERLRRSVDGG